MATTAKTGGTGTTNPEHDVRNQRGQRICHFLEELH